MRTMSNFVKRVRDIMRNDSGVTGDAQRIEQIVWMLFLKVYDSKEALQASLWVRNAVFASN